MSNRSSTNNFAYPSSLLIFRRSAETNTDNPTDQTVTIHRKSMAGPMVKCKNLKATSSAVALISDNRMRFQAEPTRLPNPSHETLHQSGPLSGKVRRIDIKLKIMIETRADFSSIKCNGKTKKGITIRPNATCASCGLSLGTPTSHRL